MDALLGLPSRGCLEVVEGIRALQAPVRTYVCYDAAAASADSVMITNTAQQLHELYRNTHRRQQHAVLKRPAHQASERNGKRHQSLHPGTGDLTLDAAIAAVTGRTQKPSSAAATAAAAGQNSQQGASKPCTELQVAARAEGAESDGRRVKHNSAPLQQPVPSPIPGTTTQPVDNSKSSKHMYTIEQLKVKTNKELIELLRARKCPVSGQKVELIRRLMDYQRRVKLAQCSTLNR